MYRVTQAAETQRPALLVNLPAPLTSGCFRQTRCFCYHKIERPRSKPSIVVQVVSFRDADANRKGNRKHNVDQPSKSHMSRAAQNLRSLAIVGDTAEALNRKILERIPTNARFVLIGEASHGTDDFYRQRADLTKLLIQERGFNSVVVEADFPDAFRANLYARGLNKDRSAREALGDFQRFPTWMWRNTAAESFIEWLQQWNAQQSQQGNQVGCGWYGMDVYSMHASAKAVIDYLKATDPEAAKRAEARYRCFDRYGADAQSYGMAVGVFRRPSCQDAAVTMLREIRRKATELRQAESRLDKEMGLQLEANAAVVKGAEEYYRQMFFGEELTWNLRDRHFMETVKLVERHVGNLGGEPRLVLWAHNSHLGDARATDMSWRRGELNVGQLARETYPGETFTIGFTTHTGTVAAADEWDEPMQVKRVNPSRPDCWERVMHDAGIPHFAVDTREQAARDVLKGTQLERAIGVVYRPDTERWSHYFDANIVDQFDLVIHKEVSQAVTPIDKHAVEDLSPYGDVPETFPFAL